MRMVTIVGLYGKGNEIISWRLLWVGSCLVLNNNYHCMCCHHWNTLHQIYTSRIRNENIRQDTKIFFGDDNIHSFSCVVGKRWKTFFYMWVPLSNVIVTTIFWSVSWAAVCSFPHRQCNKWIPKSLMVWPHLNRERCKTIGCGLLRQIWSVIRKWAEDRWNEGVLGRTNN